MSPTLSPVTADGIRYIYTARPGNTVNVVLLHGIGTSLDFWAPVLPLLPDSITVLCPDLPGSGWSDFNGDSYDIAGIAEQLDLFLQTLLEGDTVLVGHSLGALVAIELAAQRPATYQKLVLVDPVLFDVERVLTRLTAFLTNPGLAITVVSQLLGVVPNGHVSATVLRSAFLRRVLLADQVGDGGAVEADLLARCLAGTRGWPTFKVGDVLRAASRVRLDDRLRRSRTPFSVIRGSKDPLSTTADLRRLRDFEGFEAIVEIDGTGHSPMLDKPAQLAAAIVQSLGVVS